MTYDRPLYHPHASSHGSSLEWEISEIREEYIAAIDKFPPFHSAHEGYAVLLEELDELWTEVQANNGKGDPDVRLANMRHEAIQVGAMALRFLIDITPDPKWYRPGGPET